MLLERIRAEKEELVKQGKIKRDKKESVIFKGDDNSYYQDLPQNWQVSTLREITTPLTLNDGDWILSENMTDNGEVKLLQLGSIGNMPSVGLRRALAIADRLGHESIEVTYRYAHLFPSKQTEMANKLDDLGKGDF